MTPAKLDALNLDVWLSRLQLSIDAINAAYDPARAPELESRLNRAYDGIRAVYDRNQCDIAQRLRACSDIGPDPEKVPECLKCHNYTMALDGRPMCLISRRALE